MGIYWTAKSIPELRDLPDTRARALWAKVWSRYWGSLPSWLLKLAFVAAWYAWLRLCEETLMGRARLGFFLIGLAPLLVLWHLAEMAMKRRVLVRLLAEEGDAGDPTPRF